jgi:two-component system C4-dicarboxylate transport response regulator DctD
VVQERCLERLGSNTLLPVDCRIIAATKADLKKLSDQGGFRADLYYRLNVVSIDLPPLRERPEDIAPLMAYYLAQASERFKKPAPTWDESDLVRWHQYDWPGNVRELKAVAERFCLGVSDGLEPAQFNTASLATRMEIFERGLIRDALRASKGNVADAADQMHVPKKTFYDKITRHGLNPDHFR